MRLQWLTNNHRLQLVSARCIISRSFNFFQMLHLSDEIGIKPVIHLVLKSMVRAQCEYITSGKDIQHQISFESTKYFEYIWTVFIIIYLS